MNVTLFHIFLCKTNTLTESSESRTDRSVRILDTRVDSIFVDVTMNIVRKGRKVIDVRRGTHIRDRKEERNSEIQLNLRV